MLITTGRQAAPSAPAIFSPFLHALLAGPPVKVPGHPNRLAPARGAGAGGPAERAGPAPPGFAFLAFAA